MTATMYPAEGGAWDPESAPPGNDEALLTRMQRDYNYALNHPDWIEIRKQAELDQRALSITGPWRQSDIDARSKPGMERPCIHLDQLSQYINALCNEAKSNPIAIKAEAAGGQANEDTAKLREDRIRAIEYESKASMVRMNAFQHMVEHSYGFYGITVEYKSWDSFQQVIRYRAFPNPHAVMIDPDAMQPDWSDMRFCFVLSRIQRTQYEEQYPEAKIHDFGQEYIESGWIDDSTIQIAEYWYRDNVKRRMMMVESPDFQGQPFRVFRDQLKTGFAIPGGQKVFLEGYKIERNAIILADGSQWNILDSRDTWEPRIYMALTNGAEILTKPQRWLGKWIPIFPLIGRQRFELKGNRVQRVLDSYTRKGRDGQMLFDYYASSESELVAMTPKTPYKAIRGQIDINRNQWMNIHRAPMGVIEYDAFHPDMPGTLLPPPQRDVWEPPIQAVEIGKEAARRAIQAAIGSYGVTRLDDTNVKSGIALERLKAQNDMGSYHYMDMLKLMIQHDGRVVNDLLDNVEIGEVEVGLRSIDGAFSVKKVNTDDDPKSRYRLTDEDQHEITISTGLPYQSQREEAQSVGETMISNLQTIAQVIGPERAARILALVLKMRTLGPDGDKMIEVISPDPSKGPDPQAMSAELQRWQQLAQALGQKVQALEAERAAKLITIESNERIAAMKADIDLLKVQLEAATRLIEFKNAEMADAKARIDQVAADNTSRASNEQSGMGSQV